jgi:hypothetical protein
MYGMIDQVRPGALGTTQKGTHVSMRQRAALQQLLNGSLRRCSGAVLDGLRRRGWTHDVGRAYQLTEEGRRIAEWCERSPEGREVIVPS